AAATRYATSGSSHRRMSALLQFAPEELVGELRVGLAAAPLHHLPDEEPECLLLAGAELRRGIGILLDHVANDREQRAFIAVLRKPLGGDDLFGRAPRVVHLREDIFRDRAA